MTETFGGKEHVLRAAQADAARTRCPRGSCVFRRVRIGAYGAAFVFDSPLQQHVQFRMMLAGAAQRQLPGEDPAGAAFERKPVAFREAASADL